MLTTCLDTLLTLGSAMFVVTASVAPGEPLRPVLERYPSRAALQQRIDEAIRSNPEAFELAKQDFDQAIWGPRSVPWATQPKRAKRPRPIKDDGPKSNVLKARVHWER